MVLIASLTFLGFCLLVLGLLFGLGGVAMTGAAFLFGVPAAAVMFYGSLILFRPPQH